MGAAEAGHEHELHLRLRSAAEGLGIPLRMPRELLGDFMTAQDRTIIMLAHMDYMAHLKEQPSHYWQIARELRNSLNDGEPNLFGLELGADLDKDDRRIVTELLERGSCQEYEDLMVL